MVRNSAAVADVRLTLLMQNQVVFEEQYPGIITEFVSAFTYRNTTAGFIEYAQGDHALASVIETMYMNSPCARSIVAAKSLTYEQRTSCIQRDQPTLLTVQEYAESVRRILSNVAAVRAFVIDYFFKWQSIAEVDTVTYIAALHWEYISRKDDVSDMG